MGNMPLDTRGKRPNFFTDPAIDTMMTALLETMAENWALKERLLAMEKALVASGALKPGEIEAMRWTEEETASHEADRQRFLTDAFRSLNSEFQGLSARVESIDS